MTPDNFMRQPQKTVEFDCWFLREVQAGLDAADAGQVFSAEQIEAEAAAWRAEIRRKLAGAAGCREN